MTSHEDLSQAPGNDRDRHLQSCIPAVGADVSPDDDTITSSDLASLSQHMNM
jgi:hypothetical protein